VGPHVSGSAFKLVNARAYHHGTMLIDAKLKDLKGVLSNEKVNHLVKIFVRTCKVRANRKAAHVFQASSMVSKGVESVPSPVRNLREWDSLLNHSTFFEAVANQFIHVYGGDRQAVKIVQEDDLQKNEFLKRSFDELQSWDWQWGQTPEFSIKTTAQLTWGTVVGCLVIYIDSLAVINSCFYRRIWISPHTTV
jgi:lipoate-protein ligase A